MSDFNYSEEERFRKYAEAHGCGCEHGDKVYMVDETGDEAAFYCDAYIRPLPCVRDEHGAIKNQTVKDLVEKIDSELTELKWELASYPSNYVAFYYAESVRPIEWVRIADEAADTITAITTLLEALGIDVEARNEAQRRVNSKNRERGRL